MTSRGKPVSDITSRGNCSVSMRAATPRVQEAVSRSAGALAITTVRVPSAAKVIDVEMTTVAVTLSSPFALEL